jgi:hypothetical protein
MEGCVTVAVVVVVVVVFDLGVDRMVACGAGISGKCLRMLRCVPALRVSVLSCLGSALLVVPRAWHGRATL